MKENRYKVIDKIEYCPKCKELMERRMHQNLIPTTKMRGYYSQWDWCPRCRYLKHYPKYKVILTK